MTTTLPYGSWPSPITAQDVAAGAHPVDTGRYVGDEIWWAERVPGEGGRTAIRRVAASAEGDRVVTSVLPAPWDVRSRVHEYGGGAWTADDDGTVYFVEGSDQRIRMLRPGAEPEVLTPSGHGMRFAELTRAGDVLLAVREIHDGSAVPPRDIVAVPLDGSGAENADALTRLVGGDDFVAYPRLSPDGARLAWIAWNHPDMPWDATVLRVARLRAGRVDDVQTLAGGPGVSVLQPEWVDAETLLYVSDRSGRWNLQRQRIGEPARAIAPADADTGGPLWNLGIRWFAPMEDGRVLAVRTHGADTLVVIGPDDEVRPVPAEASSRVLLGDARGSRVLLSGAGAATFGGLWELDLDTAAPVPRLVRSAVDDTPDAAWLPPSREITVDGPHGPVHAFVYPPTHPDVTGPVDERAPYLVLAHGGPTSHVSGGASLDVAYFTSRGIGVLDVNYGGSTGYGRAYRQRLAGQWGIVDRDDVVAAASGLADAGVADGRRLAIKGGSAGGWTVLCALTATDRFAAGISRYGVADLRALAADTHDFEARYLDGLVGPYPQAEAVYLQRSPLSHLDRFTTPMLIEQGLDDPVVPPAQSEAVRDALASRSIAHAYLAFAGESHGFRRPDTIVRALEAELSFLGQVLGFVPEGVAPLPLA